MLGGCGVGVPITLIINDFMYLSGSFLEQFAYVSFRDGALMAMVNMYYYYYM